MLKSLFIQNYAIIEELRMDFDPLLNIITGETGAGKSILTGALGLIQGNRADTKVLYDKDAKCIVEAEFHSELNLSAMFKEAEIEFDGEIIIRRMITPSGKSRAFVNDEPVNLKFIRELSNHLLDMHRQFDTLGINDENTQINILDSVAEQQDVIDAYRIKYQSYRSKKNQLTSLIEEEHKILQELDFLSFQLNELDELSFQQGEQTQLESDVKMMENADGLVSVFQKLSYVLNGADHNIVQQLSEIRGEMDRLGELHEEGEQYKERLYGIIEELRDFGHHSEMMEQSVELDPSTLEEKQRRLNELYRMLQKHQKEDLNELLKHHESLADEVMRLKSYSKDRSSLEKELESLKAELMGQAQKISSSRKKASEIVEKKILALLGDLGMKHAQLQIDIHTSDELRSHGNDEVQFLFSANPGKDPQALNEVASGGELSRLALSLKSLVAGKMALGTLIFDEIDSGVSGDVAGKMGVLLKKLADSHQLISITHSPQIASKADKHFFIYKTVNNNRTFTKVKPLIQDERIEEIAKMLSGDPPSTAALANAEELLKG